MIKDAKALLAFEREWLAQQTISPDDNWKILEAMYDEARLFGLFPPKNPLEGLEDKIRLARVIHAFSIAS